MSKGQWSAADKKVKRMGVGVFLGSDGRPWGKRPPFAFSYQIHWGFRAKVGWQSRQNELEGVRKALAGVPAQEWPLDVPGNTRARRSRKWRRAHRAFPPHGITFDRSLMQISEPSPAADLDD